MILKLTIEVKSKAEAYRITSKLGFNSKVLTAEVDGYKETFDGSNQPNAFLKDDYEKQALKTNEELYPAKEDQPVAEITK